MIAVNDPPFVHFDPNLSPTLPVLPLSSRSHNARYVIGRDKVLLVPSDTVLDDVDSTTALEMNISLSRKQPGDYLGIDIELANTLGINVFSGSGDELATTLWLHGRATFLMYKTVRSHSASITCN